MALLFAIAAGWVWWFANLPIDMVVSQETTHVIGPLTPDGRVDFRAAINQSMKVCAPEDNAAALLMRIVDWSGDQQSQQTQTELAAAIGAKLESIAPDEVLISYRDYVLQVAQAELEGALTETENVPARFETEPWSAAEYPLAAQWLEGIEPSLKLVEQAANKPAFYRPVILGEDDELITALLIDFQTMRLAAKALSCRAMLRIESRTLESAVDDIELMYQLGAWCSECPFMIVELMQASIYKVADLALQAALDTGSLSEGDAKRLQARISASPHLTGLDQMLDLAARLMILQTMIKRHIEDHPRPQDSLLVRFNMRLIDWNLALAEINKVYDEVLPLVRLTNPQEFHVQRSIVLSNLPSDQNIAGRSNSFGGVISKLKFASQQFGRKIATTTFPRFDNIWYLRRNLMMKSRQNLLALGTVRYYRRHGSFPPNLEELVAESLVAVPTDELSDAPLDYSETPTEAVIKSPGVNGPLFPGMYDGYFAEIETRIPALK